MHTLSNGLLALNASDLLPLFFFWGQCNLYMSIISHVHNVSIRHSACVHFKLLYMPRYTELSHWLHSEFILHDVYLSTL